MTSALTDARASAAAEAAVGLLPAPTPLAVGTPINEPVELFGQAISASFTGSAQGQIAVIVGPELVGALALSPLGALDITQAVRPALEAAASTLGPVVVDPGEEGDPASAMQNIVDAGGLLVPLVEEGSAGSEVRAMVGLVLKAQIGGVRGGADDDEDVLEGDLDDGDMGGMGPGMGGGMGPGGAVAAGFEPLTPGPRGAPVVRGGLELLHDVEMEVTAELGRTRMSVRDLLSLAPGAVIELDRLAGGPADLLVNGRLIARGEVVVIDENFGIRITEIVA